MLENPHLYPVPIPEPRFGIRDFFAGPHSELGRPPGRPPRPPEGRVRPGPGPPPPPPRPAPASGAAATTRIVIALVIALVAGTLLSRRFTRPLSELAKGAETFQAGDFQHRIPAGGDDEFSRVAEAMNSMAQRVSCQIGRLEEDAKRRQQFLADIAHELRSPVATMRTMVEALEDGTADNPERRSRALSSLVQASERLLHLVSDLLELAKLDLKELPMHRRQVDLRALASAAVDSHAASAAQAGIALHPVETGAPLIANVDPDRLTQVLDNLLDNAISYAGKGAEMRVTLEAGQAVRLVVSDNGKGIPADHLPYVFEPFYRADSARTPAKGHSGLGLRISRRLIEAHGGELIVNSKEGEGTTAVITLPRGSCASGRKA